MWTRIGVCFPSPHLRVRALQETTLDDISRATSPSLKTTLNTEKNAFPRPRTEMQSGLELGIRRSGNVSTG